MKLLISPISIVIVMILISCGGQKNTMFEKEDAMTFNKATYSKWVAGIKGGGAGYVIQLELAPDNKDIQLDSIYFKTFSASLVGNKAGLYSGFIDNGQNKEITLPVYGDTPKEEKASAPQNTQTLFELIGNEAVVSYAQKGIRKYYKLTLTIDNTLELPR